MSTVSGDPLQFTNVDWNPLGEEREEWQGNDPDYIVNPTVIGTECLEYTV